MQIHKYVCQGDVAGVCRELAKGTPVDIRDKEDLTPLAYAAREPAAPEEILRLLIEAGADVDAMVQESRSFPLALAAATGDLNKVRLLLSAGANIDTVTPKGYGVLVFAVYALQDDDRLLSVVRFLAENGADVDHRSRYGESPIKAASFAGRFDAVKHLLEAGADPAPLMWTELMRAIAWGSCVDVRRHLTSAESLDYWDSLERTPWLLAAWVGDSDKAKLLLAAGANVEDRDRGGVTALMHCAARNQGTMLKWLIEIGADCEATDEMGGTALMRAAQAGAATCVELLLQAGADVNYTTSYYDESVIHVASTPEVLRLLVRAGADLTDASDEIKRKLTGLDGYEQINCTKAEYQAGKRRRFGRSNPQVMEIPFWREMVRSGATAYAASSHFDDTNASCGPVLSCDGTLLDPSGPVWCFNRFGASFTELPDGRYVQIGGEHEDSYDPDFCIYNDVVLHEPSGEFQILGYPESVFPSTDFHTATCFDGAIYIVGRLGYHGVRQYGATPVYRLDCRKWSMTEVATRGENPGWIYKHRARLSDGELVITGGTICRLVDGREEHCENTDVFHLDLGKKNWTRA